MGIPHYYAWIRKHKLLSRTIKNVLPRNVSSFSIDVNGILHGVAQKVFAYGDQLSSELIQQRRKEIAGKTEEQLMKEYKMALFSEFERVILLVRPRDTICFAVDGIAPRAKQNQQRQRRYIASLDRTKRKAKTTVDLSALIKELKNDKTKIRTSFNNIKKKIKNLDFLLETSIKDLKLLEKTLKKQEKKKPRNWRLIKSTKIRIKNLTVKIGKIKSGELKKQYEKTGKEIKKDFNKIKKSLENAEIRQKSVTSKGFVFDSNSITPGTVFMSHINNYLTEFVNNNKFLSGDGDYILPPKMILSTSDTPGEGEHKIFQFFRNGDMDSKNRQGAHIIHGLDADLILLSMVSQTDNLYLLREGGHRQRENEVSLININEFRINIWKLMNLKFLKPSMENYIDDSHIDYMLIMQFVGSDFLPHQPSLESFKAGLNALIETYRNLDFKYKPLHWRDDNGNQWIDWENLLYFLNDFSQKEMSLLEYITSTIQPRKRDNRLKLQALEDATSKIFVGEGAKTLASNRGRDNIKYTFNFKDFRMNWYFYILEPKGIPEISEYLKWDVNIREAIEESFPIGVPPEDQTPGSSRYNAVNDIFNMSINYFEGIKWVFNYYTKGIDSVNKRWNYQYFYTPLIVDLVKNLNILIQNIVRGNIKSIDEVLVKVFAKVSGSPTQTYNNVLYQLLSVFPPSSVELLPEKIRFLMTSESSPIRDLFPLDFEIDMQGKSADWQGIAILPFANLERIEEAVKNNVSFTIAEAEKYQSRSSVMITRGVNRSDFENTDISLIARNSFVPGARVKHSFSKRPDSGPVEAPTVEKVVTRKLIVVNTYLNWKSLRTYMNMPLQFAKKRKTYKVKFLNIDPNSYTARKDRIIGEGYDNSGDLATNIRTDHPDSVYEGYDQVDYMEGSTNEEDDEDWGQYAEDSWGGEINTNWADD